MVLVPGNPAVRRGKEALVEAGVGVTVPDSPLWHLSNVLRDHFSSHHSKPKADEASLSVNTVNEHDDCLGLGTSCIQLFLKSPCLPPESPGCSMHAGKKCVFFCC